MRYRQKGPNCFGTSVGMLTCLPQEVFPMRAGQAPEAAIVAFGSVAVDAVMRDSSMILWNDYLGTLGFRLRERGYKFPGSECLLNLLISMEGGGFAGHTVVVEPDGTIYDPNGSLDGLPAESIEDTYCNIMRMSYMEVEGELKSDAFSLANRARRAIIKVFMSIRRLAGD